VSWQGARICLFPSNDPLHVANWLNKEPNKSISVSLVGVIPLISYSNQLIL
jgi:hypothetical protein